MNAQETQDDIIFGKDSFVELENTIIIFEEEKPDKSLTKDYGIINQEKKRITDRTMRNVLYPFEMTRIICERAEQLRRGAPPKIDIINMKWTYSREKYEKIAEEELRQRKLNIIIRRYDADKCFEDWHVSELAY